MPKAALHNLGCKVNAYETEAMEQQLWEQGYEIVPFDQKADVYIINTCSVTNIADKKSRQMLHRARKMNPDAVVVAAGCYVQVAADTLKKDACVDVMIGNNMKGQLGQILEEYFKSRRTGGCMDTAHAEEGGEAQADSHVLDISHTRDYESLHVSRLNSHTRAFLKVQDGCNQFCSYCIIPHARGRVRSRSREDVVREAKELAARGYKEVVLTGIHLSSYGIEHLEEGPIKDGDWNHRALLSLILDIHDIPGIERIRLGSLEPRIITREFAGALSGLSKFCPHFHLSLQSGCDATLKRMNRHYTPEDYKKRCEILRSCFERPAITTDVIVGFPGETREEFEVTRRFLEQLDFYEMHVFKYSRRAGTRAALMARQVSETEKSERSQILLDLGHSMSVKYRRGFVGERVSLLLEEMTDIEGGMYMVGYTPQYVRTALPAGGKDSHALSGAILTCTASGLLGEDLLLAEP